MDLTEINPVDYPHLFVEPSVKLARERRRSFLEQLVTSLRKHRRRERVDREPDIITYIDHFFLQCTDTRPSRLHRVIQGKTLLISGISHIYYARLMNLLQVVRKVNPRITCKLYSQLVAFNTS